MTAELEGIIIGYNFKDFVFDEDDRYYSSKCGSKKAQKSKGKLYLSTNLKYHQRVQNSLLKKDR